MVGHQDLGYLPEAMFNFIALLGWSPVGEDEIFSQKELIDIFDENRLSRSPASFDAKKLEWVNNQYMKKVDLSRLVDMCHPHLVKAGRLPEELNVDQKVWEEKLVSLYQEQMSYAAEIVGLSDLFFDEHPVLDDAAKEVLAGEGVETVVKDFKEKFEALETVDNAAVLATIKAVQKDTGIKGKNLWMPIRVATTGQTHGPGLGEAIELLGKEKTLSHIQQIMNF